MPDTTLSVTHHLYSYSADLLPACGAVPGPEVSQGRWNTGDEAAALLIHAVQGHGCCLLCVQLAKREIAAGRTN